MSTYADRLKALREQLKAEKLDGFVVPLTDEHMSEYVGSYAQRLAWLTGFQGSAGSAVVLPEQAAIFVDGRYTLQVRQQVSATEWSYQSVPETSTTQWLEEHAPEGARIGYDPWLHTRDWVKKAKEALATRGAELVPVEQKSDRRNLEGPARSRRRRTSSSSRTNMPASRPRRSGPRSATGSSSTMPMLPYCPHSTRSPGRSTSAARTSTHTPVALAYALVHADGTADLFVASEKIGPEVRQHLGNGVRLHERSEFESALSRAQGQDGRRRSRARGRGDFRSARKGRRENPAAARSDDPSQGDQEPGRNRRPESRADPRWDGDRSLPPLDRRRGAEGRRRRADRVRQVRSHAPRELPSFAISRSTASRARARTARSSITSRARRPTASSRRARST